VETGNLPVIGLRDVICHVAAVLKEGSHRQIETRLRNHYVDRLCLRELTRRVQCQLINLGWLPPGVVGSRILLNFFNPWMAAECGQRAESQDACRLSEVTRRV